MNQQLPVVSRFGSLKPRSKILRAARPILFEFSSLLGRIFSTRKRKPAKFLLQLGCGSNISKNFENIDFYNFKPWDKSYIGHDLRFRLPYEDNVFLGVFSEHTLEHLSPADAINLLKEVNRVMVKGSIFRIIVPDLEKYTKFYFKNSENWIDNKDFSVFESGCEAIWNLTQNWGHISCWDYDMIRSKLLEAGFVNIKRLSFNVTDDPRLLLDLPHRKWESLYVEASA